MSESPVLRRPEQLIPGDAPDDLRRFVEYWITKAAGRLMPRFEDIDAIEIPWALSRFYLVRAVDGGAAFVYRLTGESIRERHGTALVGRTPGDLFPEDLARQITDRWRQLIHEPAACYTLTEHPTNVGRLMRARRTMLPLGPPEGPADHIMGMTIFETLSSDNSSIDWATPVDIRWLKLR